MRGVPRGARGVPDARGGRARASRPHDAAGPAGAVRRALRPREARPLGARLRGPRAGGARPAAPRRGPARGVLVALRARVGGRVPGHEPAPERAARPALAREPVPRRGREPVDLPLQERRRERVPRALARGPGGRTRREHHRELPLARRGARRDRPRVRAHMGRELRAAPRGARVARAGGAGPAVRGPARGGQGARRLEGDDGAGRSVRRGAPRRVSRGARRRRACSRSGSTSSPAGARGRTATW